MFEFTEDPFDNLLVQIRVYSPNCIPLLQQMREDCGRSAGYYAAFLLICLDAITGKKYDRPLNEYTATDFQDFAFFEVAKADLHALMLFDKLLEVYKQDRVTALS